MMKEIKIERNNGPMRFIFVSENGPTTAPDIRPFNEILSEIGLGENEKGDLFSYLNEAKEEREQVVDLACSAYTATTGNDNEDDGA